MAQPAENAAVTALEHVFDRAAAAVTADGNFSAERRDGLARAFSEAKSRIFSFVRERCAVADEGELYLCNGLRSGPFRQPSLQTSSRWTGTSLERCSSWVPSCNASRRRSKLHGSGIARPFPPPLAQLLKRGSKLLEMTSTLQPPTPGLRLQLAMPSVSQAELLVDQSDPGAPARHLMRLPSLSSCVRVGVRDGQHCLGTPYRLPHLPLLQASPMMRHWTLRGASRLSAPLSSRRSGTRQMRLWR